ncbi:hypothetical protein KRX57_06620 [Weeksellaceae bacterium TAE3-ERU29]|nr:hypothetical protein [Weeksellaceae bacterium TAE3-ERU29]
MTTDALKINLAQKILSLDDSILLEKIKDLLKVEDTSVYYTTTGEALTEKAFIAEMDNQQERIKKGEAKFHSIEDVRKKVLHASRLGE